MPPRGSKLQRQKSNSEQQLNNDGQSHLSESNQKSDSEIPIPIKQPVGTDSDESQQQSAASIEFQKQQDALTSFSQHNFVLPTNDQEEESKDFPESKSKIQDIKFDGIIKMLSNREFNENQEKMLQNLHKFHNNFEENDVLQIFNILNFLTECFPFFKLCPFLTKEKKLSFINEVQKLLNFNENDDICQKYFQNVSSFCSDFDNLFGIQYNTKPFQNIFRENFSNLTSVLHNAIQQITNRGKIDLFKDDFQKVRESMTFLYIHFKILMKTQRIRTAISFVDKLLQSESDFNQFLIKADLMANDLFDKISNQFDLLIKLTLHLKLLFMIHQFIEIIDHIAAKINNKQRTQLQNNEIIEYTEKQPQENSIGYLLYDEFNFHTNMQTDFLRLANEFTNQLDIDMNIDDFKRLVSELLNKSSLLLNQSFHQCGLKPILFSLNYHYRMIQSATSLMIPLLKTEQLDNIDYLQKIFVALKFLLKKFSCFQGKDIELGIINNLSFSLIMQIKDLFRLTKIKRSYKGTSSFQSVDKYIKLFVKDLETIENTICFAHQIDFFAKKFNIVDSESCFNFNCQFYSPIEIDLSVGYDNTKEINIETHETDNYQDIINEIALELHSHGYDMLPEGFSQSSNIEILAPNISNVIQTMLNYGTYAQIRKIIENPNQLSNEENLFKLIDEIYEKIIDKPQNALQLKESICVYINTYFLLKVLAYAGKIDFANAVHLMYFGTHASIILNSDLNEKLYLTSLFDPTYLSCYDFIRKKLDNLSEFKQINDEISHTRLYFYKFAGNVFQLDLQILSANLNIFSHILEWFSNPKNESNQKFLSCKYLEQVKLLKNVFSENILKMKQNRIKRTQKQKNILRNMIEIEMILDSIINIQIHYIQFSKIELIIPYLRSFFHLKEDDKRFCRFLSFYPVWFNSVHRCLNYNLIKCDENILTSSFKSTLTNVIKNSERLISTFDVHYLNFFNELISLSLKTNDQSICMMIDIIVRGSFSFENVSKLFHYVLKYFVSFSNDPNSPKSKSNDIASSRLNFDLWKNVVKLSCLLIAVNTHSHLHKELDINLLRMINLKNYVNSYINGFLYLYSSSLSTVLDNKCSQKILENLEYLQKIDSEIPITMKIHKTYYIINKIISIIDATNRYIVEVGPEEGFIARTESFIRNIQDKKIRKAFKSSLRVAYLSGTTSQGSTTLLSKSSTGSPVSAAQTAISNGYESIFYNKNEDNYLDGMNDEVEEYIDVDEDFNLFLQKNNDNGGNSNYFNDDEDTNVNIVACALNKNLISECFNDDERRIENYVKAIDSINCLSLYLSIVIESNSFMKFATLDFSSDVRMNPPFAICKPSNWDKSGNVRNNIITVNLNSNTQQATQQATTENIQDATPITNETGINLSSQNQNQNQNNSDWLKCDYISFISSIDNSNNINNISDDNNINNQVQQNNNLNQNQNQNQIIPLQYAFNDTGISSSKFRLKNYYNNAQQALKRQIPADAPIDFDSDQLLPINIQQQLLDQINENQKGMNPEYLEVLKRQSLQEKLEDRRKQLEKQQSFERQQLLLQQQQQQKERDHLQQQGSPEKFRKEGENEEEENNDVTPISSLEFNRIDNEPEKIEDGFKLRDDEEDKPEHDQNIDDNEGSDFQDDNEHETEVKRGRGRRRGRGRAGQKRGPRGSRGRNSERSNASLSAHSSSTKANASPTIGSGVPIPPPITAPATKNLSDLRWHIAKLNQLEADEIKARERKESIAREQVRLNTVIQQTGSQIQGLAESTNEHEKRRNDHCELMKKYNSASVEYALKKEQLKQIQNSSKAYQMSSSIGQKAAESYTKISEANKADMSLKAMGNQQEKIKDGFNLFNPFKLNQFNSKKNNRSSSIEKEEINKDETEIQKQIEKQRKEEFLSPAELLSLHQKQIASIAQRKIKQKQQKASNESEINQMKMTPVSSLENEAVNVFKDQEGQIKSEQIHQNQNESNSNNQPQGQADDDYIDENLEREQIDSSPTIGQLFDQETPEFNSLPLSLRNLTRPVWALRLSKDEADSNNEIMGSQKADNYENEKRNVKTSLNGQSDRLLNENPFDLQQRFTLSEKRMSSLISFTSELNNGNDDRNKSYSSKKQNRSDKTKNEGDSNSRKNDNQTLSDADTEMTRDNQSGFVIDNDVGFGFESDGGTGLF